jgi:hypothetical protein
MAILRVDPNCSITYTNIKTCVLNIFQKCPECKPNKTAMHAQAGDVANIAMVLQAHLRRLATGHEHEKEQEKARSSLSHCPELLENASGKSELPQAQEPPAVAYRDVKSLSSFELRGHILVRNQSDASETSPSQDSSGLPTMSFMLGMRTSSGSGSATASALQKAEALAATIPALRASQKAAEKAKAEEKAKAKALEKVKAKATEKVKAKATEKVKAKATAKATSQKAAGKVKQQILKKPIKAPAHHVTKQCAKGWVLHTITRSATSKQGGSTYNQYTSPKGGKRIRTLVAAQELGFIG